MDTETFSIRNPLEAKETSFASLEEVAAKAQKERNEWLDAELKKILPKWAYDMAHRCLKEKTFPESVVRYMDANRIEICHNGLHTWITVKGKVVAQFELKLVCAN